MRIYPFFLSHAGCPHRCLFCRQSAGGEAGLPLTPGRFSDELPRMMGKARGGEVAFYGGTFTLLPEDLQEAFFEAAAPFLRDGRIDGLRISTRPDALAADVVQRLGTAGVKTVEIGCQSFSPEVLRLSGRGHGAEETGESVRRLRRAGLSVGLQLMPGLPGGNQTEALSSLRQALDLQPDFLRIYPTVVLRGTGLEERYRRGEYRPLELGEAVALCAEMLWHCRRASVPVIRMGLQSTPGLDSGSDLAAGPYHPAFGHLVRSFLWRGALETGQALAGGRRATLHPWDLSDAVGYRRENLLWIREKEPDFGFDCDSGIPRGWMNLAGRSFSLDQLLLQRISNKHG